MMDEKELDILIEKVKNGQASLEEKDQLLGQLLILVQDIKSIIKK
jgi:hypothetical protein